MKHLGSITDIDWSKVPPVDVVTGGSPCQNLSSAGNRKGLAGAESQLFFEIIRCIKELRKEDEKCGRSAESIRPRFAVWENVKGAFSSNKGEDFRTVLEEFARVREPNASIPRPERGGWKHAGAICGNGWSLAWRLHNAQYWGVPQRRERIALFCDFGGYSAPEVLFESESLSRYPETGGEAWHGASNGVEGCSDKSEYGVIILNDQGGAQMCATRRKIGTLRAQAHGNNPIVYDARGNGDGATVCTITGDHNSRITDYTALCIGNGQVQQLTPTKEARTLNCMHDQQAVFIQATPINSMLATRGNKLGDRTGMGIGNKGDPQYSISCNHSHDVFGEPVAHTLKAKANLDFRYDSESYPVQNGCVRRITPKECELLQGFPPEWTNIPPTRVDGKLVKCSDSARYKALGNSIALPFWHWLLERISAQYDYTPTLGSLFDGIGGFPLCWERINGKGTALWASEIERFCIAVTMYHFPEEEKSHESK